MDIFNCFFIQKFSFYRRQKKEKFFGKSKYGTKKNQENGKMIDFQFLFPAQKTFLEPHPIFFF